VSHTPPPPGHWPPTPPLRRSGRGTTTALAVLHSLLVAATALLTVAVVFVSLDDPHEQCKYHGLHCDRGAHRHEDVLVGVVGSAVLIILDIVLTIVFWRKRPQLAFVVPLACCIGQLIVAGAVVSHGAS